jgi:hypothetical protein
MYVKKMAPGDSGGTPPVTVEVPAEFAGKVDPETWAQIQAAGQREIDARVDERMKTVAPKPPVTPMAPVAPAPIFSPQFTPPPPQAFPQFQQQEEEPNILMNPRGFLEDDYKRRVKPIIDRQNESMRVQNSTAFRMNDPEFYAKYGQQVEQFVSSFDPILQADPRSYQAAAQLIKGSPEYASYLREKARAEYLEELKTQGTYVAPAGSPPPVQPRAGYFGGAVVPLAEGGQGAGQKPKNVVQLNEEQKRIADNFGMTDEEYAEQAGLNTDLYSVLGRKQP